MTLFIDEHRSRFGVAAICRTLGWCESTYWNRKWRPPSDRELRDAELKPRIVEVFEDNYSVYGAYKVWRELHRQHVTVARCTVERLMRELGLRGATRGRSRWPVTTRADERAERPADLVDRDFTAARPNQTWVADLTYVRVRDRFAYVAFVVDVFSRMIVGWSLATHLRTDLPLDALELAVWLRREHDLDGLIHHSDAGTQGGLKRPSQHLEMRSCDGTFCWMGVRKDRTAADAFAWSSAGVARRGPRAVLVGDRRRGEHRGCCRDRGRVARGRVSVVPSWRWHADRPVQQALGPVSVIRGT
jgi:putative transposase